MRHSTRFHFFLMLLAGLLGLVQPGRAQPGPAWARLAGGSLVATGGTDYVYAVGGATPRPVGSGPAQTIASYTSQGQRRWTQTLTGGTVRALVADTAGYLWVTGSSSNGLSTGGLTLSSGGFIIKYAPQGTVVWARAIGLTQGLNPVSIGLGSNGQVHIASLGGPYAAWPGVNGFLLSYDATGALQQMHHMPGANVQTLTVDARNNVWLAGNFQTTANFGGIVLASAGRNGFLACYAAQGPVQWAKIFAAPISSATVPVVGGLTAHGSTVYLTCPVIGTLQFDSSLVTAPAGTNLQVLLRYDAQGNLQWLRQISGAGAAFVQADASGNALVAGFFEGDLRPHPLSASAASLDADLFLLHYSPQGAAQWLRHERIAAHQLLSGMAIDAAGNVYGTGHSLGPGVIQVADTVLPATSSFLVRFGSSVLSNKAPAAFGSLSLSPNPGRAGEPARLNWTAPAAPGTTLTLLNTLGQVLRTQPVAAGCRTAPVATTGLTPGCYLVQLRTPAGLSTSRLVVE